jgi:putative flippase GtrA
MIKRELAIFLVVGALTVLVDFVSYRGLIGFGVMAVDMAKATGFLIGTLFAYFANRFWTFGHKPHVRGSAWRFAVLYASTLGANVLINSLALKLFVDAVAAIPLAFLVATGVSSSLNFLGMKFFVFRPSPASELQ